MNLTILLTIVCCVLVLQAFFSVLFSITMKIRDDRTYFIGYFILPYMFYLYDIIQSEEIEREKEIRKISNELKSTLEDWSEEN